MKRNALIPELYCSNFQNSFVFYTEVLGFSVSYLRENEKFAFLERQGAQLMIEQTIDPERVWILGGNQPPFGRGVSMQIATTDVKKLYEKCMQDGATIFLPLENKGYLVGTHTLNTLQFIVLDPDNYLLRFAEDLHPK